VRRLTSSVLRRAIGCVACVGVVAVAAACGGDSDGGQVIEVAAGESIQAAVDRAGSGDLVLIAPGEYSEQIVIDTENITLRGEDRNTVILDGGDALDTAVLATADGVTIENLTVRNYLTNGIVVSGVDGSGSDRQLDGFRIAYVTAYNNGLYGLYSFQAGNGTIADSYASGHPDSGVYVGQCGTPAVTGGDSAAAALEPCNVVVERLTAEYNALGYSGTNGSQVWVINSVFRSNRIGITPNSQSLELRSPQTEATIAGNLVIDNDSPDAPEQAAGGFAVGIAVGSGTANRIVNNRVVGHDGAGILVTTLDRFEPAGNEVRGNVVEDNGVDLGYWRTGGDTPLDGNCFAGNTFTTSSPASIESAMPCEAAGASTDAPVVTMPTSPEGPRYQDVPAPPSQPTMPGDVRAVPTGPPGFTEPSLDAIAVPDMP
jgi:nitrous oxidase accessory protein NosD